MYGKQCRPNQILQFVAFQLSVHCLLKPTCLHTVTAVVCTVMDNCQQHFFKNYLQWQHNRHDVQYDDDDDDDFRFNDISTHQGHLHENSVTSMMKNKEKGPRATYKQQRPRSGCVSTFCLIRAFSACHLGQPCNNMSSGICGQQRPRSACVSSGSDQGLHCLQNHLTLQNASIENKEPHSTLPICGMM